MSRISSFATSEGTRDSLADGVGRMALSRSQVQAINPRRSSIARPLPQPFWREGWSRSQRKAS